MRENRMTRNLAGKDTAEARLERIPQGSGTEERELPALSVGIKKRLRDFSLQLSFAAERGQGGGCLGILGASGCGKSMMLKSIAGIVQPDEGTICLNGRLLYDSASGVNLPPRKRRVGYLFQDYALFPNMTVEENITAGLKTGEYRRRGLPTGRDREARTAEMIRLFRLEGLEKQYPAKLSGGQKQRVALARILCYEPEMIMLDEPFSAMDAHLRERLRLEMKEILREYSGLAVMVTHDRDEAYQLCDRLILMDQGRIIGGGETKELFRSPGTVEAAVITGCKNISPIVRMGPRRVKALAWNVELTTEQTVDEGVTHIGIRAHDMISTEAGHDGAGENRVPTGRAQVWEMPFEWYVTLENGLWWKVPKHAGEYTHTFSVPETLRIPAEAILLLRTLQDAQ